ncbi:Polysialic acid biosynthesis protein P7 [Bordetella ansorpii]|uniref:Polysialic acid biosynthesis protein P7 n=1 Tax=Bordetella ansorpii TaxID=288768 RepID=A0A157SWL6_9BORD|nr:UDP-N-acetylglucosamine 2-epimerase [Bordetella ansorpii]SAI74829.1 Polysialic acid biosynthesis protein P7 [Bordetella ansorpii]
MNRRICVVTGTRAEYGLLKWLMHELKADSSVQLQVLATGAHLAPEFGYTYREIEADGFVIDRKVEMLLSSDTPSAISRSMALGLIGYADAFEQLRPDVVVILGDRYEMLSVAAAAMVARIPIAHLHGGETTEGAFDEAIRHCITKMSQLHFTGAPEYRNRVLQLGEAPERVFMFGGLGVDAIKRVSLMPRGELEQSLGLVFRRRNLLVTFHPVTLDSLSSDHQMQEMLAALESLDDTTIIFTMPNADTGGRGLAKLVEDFARQQPNVHVYASLGQRRYLSCMQFVDAVVGNSSSGIAEAPSFGIGTINIGSRQKGRLSACSVIDCDPTRTSIRIAIERLYSPAFQELLGLAVNPYGDGGASQRIAKVLANHPLDGLTMKAFHDIQFS